MKSLGFIILFIPVITFSQGVRLDEASFGRYLTNPYALYCSENCFFSIDSPERYKGHFQKSDSLTNGYADSLGNLVMLNYKFNTGNYESYVLIRNKEQIIGSLYTESIKNRRKWHPFSSLPLLILSRKDANSSSTLFFSFEQFGSGDSSIYYLRTISEVDSNGRVRKFIILNDESLEEVYIQLDKKVYANYKCELSMDSFNYYNMMNFSFNNLNTNLEKNVEMLSEPEFSPEKGSVPLINIAH